MSSHPEFPTVRVTEPSITHLPPQPSAPPTIPDDILSGRDTLQPKDYALMNDLSEDLRNVCRQKIRSLMDWMEEKPMTGRSFEHEHYDVINRDSENMMIEYDETLFADEKALGVRYYHLKIQKFGEYLPTDFTYNTHVKDGVSMTTEEIDTLCKPKEWHVLLTFDEFLVTNN